MKKKLDHSRIKQRETMKAKYGDDIYTRLAKKGGDKSPTKFNSERGREAARKRWAKKEK